MPRTDSKLMSTSPAACRTTGRTQRKAFYSYAAAPSGIAISINLKTKDVTNLQPGDIDLQFTAPGRDEEVEAWKDVFGIEERYKAKFCAKNDGMAWLQQAIEEAANGNLSTDEFLGQVSRAAIRSPYDGANFLKMAFLTACQSAKII
jgi:hypothetical protein